MSLWELTENETETQFTYLLRNLADTPGDFRELIDALDEPGAEQGLIFRDVRGDNALTLAIKLLDKNRNDPKAAKGIKKLIKKMVLKHRDILNNENYAPLENEKRKNAATGYTTPLHLIVKRSLLTKFINYIATKDNINFPDRSGCTPLSYALQHQLKRPHYVEQLLEKGANPLLSLKVQDKQFPEGYTALHFVADRNEYDICKIIVNHLATSSMTQRIFEEKSESKGDAKLEVKPIINCKFNLESIKTKSGWTPLYHAAYQGNYDIIYLLLRKFDVSVKLMEEVLKHVQQWIVDIETEETIVNVVDELIDKIENSIESKKQPANEYRKIEFFYESDEGSSSESSVDSDAEMSTHDVLREEPDEEDSDYDEDKEVEALADDDDIIELTDLEKYKEIEKLLIYKIKEKNEYNKKENFHWVSSLSFSFYKRDGRKKHAGKRWIETEGGMHHLALQILEGRKRPPEKEGDQINFASAGINFILSTKSGFVDDRFITINTQTYEQITDLVGGKEKFIAYLKKLNIKPAAYRINAKQLLESKDSNTFEEKDLEKLYNHSEQGIFFVLLQEATIKNLITDLIEYLSDFSRDIYKIEAVQILIFTSKYMCQNCQATAIAMQYSNEFENLLNKVASKEGFRVKQQSQLPINIVISSNQPYMPSLSKEAKNFDELKKLKDEYRITPEMENIVTNAEFDIRTMPRGHIFLHDLYGFISDSKIDATSFVSNKTYYDKFSKGALTLHKKYEDENKQLLDANKKLREHRNQLQEEVKKLKQAEKGQKKQEAKDKPTFFNKKLTTGTTEESSNALGQHQTGKS